MKVKDLFRILIGKGEIGVIIVDKEDDAEYTGNIVKVQDFKAYVDEKDLYELDVIELFISEDQFVQIAIREMNNNVEGDVE